MRALTVGVGILIGIGAPLLLFGLIICVLSLVNLVRG